MAVRVLLMDAAGRRVKTLADGPFSPGLHFRKVNLRGLPKGQYFLWMDAEGVRRRARLPWIR